MDKVANQTFTSEFLSTFISNQVLDKQVTAIKNNRLNILHTYSQKLVSKDSNQKNLLFYAIYYKQPSILLYLLRNSLDYKQKDSTQKSLYHIGCYTGSLECMKVLRQYIKLQRIIKYSDQYIELLNKNNYKRTDFKNGKLKYDVSQQRQKVFVKLQNESTQLYRKYVDEYLNDLKQSYLAVDNKYNRNCFHYGCLNKYQKCVQVLEYLLQQFEMKPLASYPQFIWHCNQTNSFFNPQLDPRVHQNAISLLMEIIKPDQLQMIENERKKISYKIIHEILNSKDSNQHSPLYIASKDGYTAIINLLLKYEPIHKKNQQAQQIIKIASNNLARSHIMDLCDASKQLNTNNMKFLITCGSEINQKKTIFGHFPILEAVKSFSKDHNIEPIKLLLKSGANLDQKDTNGWTIFHHAAYFGEIPILELLISQTNHLINNQVKHLMNRKTNKSYHMLHIAAMENHHHFIQFVLSNEKINHNVNINIQDQDGRTPLHWAARKGANEALKMLILMKADLYIADKLKMTALHHAAAKNCDESIRILMDASSDYEQLPQMKNSKMKIAKELCSISSCKKSFDTIFTAIRKGDINLVRKIISQKPNSKNTTTPLFHKTPLMVAIQSGKALIAKYLIQIGVDQYHEDQNGKNASEYAKQQLNKLQQDKKDIDMFKGILQLLN